jgi:hypothetical protein
MTSQLREVLNRFDDQSAPRSLKQMAREMQLEPNTLQAMIDYWVRKGKLREVNTGTACVTCGTKGACPFIVQMPRIYERVSDDAAVPALPCACSGGCSH